MNTKLIEQLQSYFDGETTPEERMRMQTVIAGSAECRELLKQWEQQRRVFGLLKKTEAGDETFVSRVMNHLQEVNEPEPVIIEIPDFFRWIFPAMGYALSTALFFFNLFSKTSGGQRRHHSFECHAPRNPQHSHGEKNRC